MKFLDFDDIIDFNNLSIKDFEEKNFYAEDIASENVIENDSNCFEEELKQDESIQTMLKGLTDKSLKKHNNEATEDGTEFQCSKLQHQNSQIGTDSIESKTEAGKNS